MPRVTVTAVTQVGVAATFINPDAGDGDAQRPATAACWKRVIIATGASFPVTVIVNHLRSSPASTTAPAERWATAGARVRAKRSRRRSTWPT